MDQVRILTGMAGVRAVTLLLLVMQLQADGHALFV